ncbi:V-set and immunoglobulin domain-containing protein 1 precursor [Xenopus laevis]|uniref:V-set and immunoglobulin domain-containing protein 1 n=1 Tax=Xenopus laevis TaxID=8355 RepID=VSIG1_XENLA|nr:V-set and immunoglobulin domain-containing protein 1 precursor [Xenopus laevis]Q91664.1 RecName: Full=V-set and immunoglobulin domain-containing protein 1; AltName: Full=Cortical thymocyte marker CTX; Flags: Precursor [Xenopus laevis]AAC59899.1 CTX [Xenopus laevis]
MSFLLFITLGLSLTALSHCVQVTIQNPIINVTSGQNATLYCTYILNNQNKNNLVIQWNIFQAKSQNQETVFFYQNGQSLSGPSYKNRVTAAMSPGNATITISNMQSQDTGIYTCEVLNLPESSGQGKILLTVLVPPSVPHCSIRGAVETGHFISLLCYSEEGMPRPIYSWNRVENGLLKSTPSQMNQQKGSLIIGNLTDFEEGYYRCTASNNLGNATCELNLHTGGEGGVIAAAVIGGLLAAAIIIAIVWFLVVKRKQKKQLPPTKEMKTGGNQYMAVSGEANEPPKENLGASEPTETIQFHDHAENAANGETEEPTA